MDSVIPDKKNVAVDIRLESPTFGQWAAVELSAENHRQFYVPEGFAHGFCALGGPVLLSYMCTAPYAADYDAAVAWNDPDIGIEWPIDRPQLSDKDAKNLRLKDIAKEELPRYA